MVQTDIQTGQVIIAGMGELHLDIIVDRPEARVRGRGRPSAKPQVAYKETLTRPADGEMSTRSDGRPRPVRPRQDSSLPASRARYVFENETNRRLDPEGFIKPIARHQGSTHPRRLARLPIDDVRIELYDGSYPRRSTRRNGVQDRRLDGVPGRRQEAKPVLLAADHALEVVSERAHGRRDGQPVQPARSDSVTEDRGGTQIINARVPLSEMFGYSTDLRSRTQGRAAYSMHSIATSRAERHERRSHRSHAG